MRVNSVDNTNFKMALKLNPKTMPEKLKEKPIFHGLFFLPLFDKSVTKYNINVKVLLIGYLM